MGRLSHDDEAHPHTAALARLGDAAEVDRQEERTVLLMIRYEIVQMIAAAGVAILVVALINPPGLWFIPISFVVGWVTVDLTDHVKDRIDRMDD